MSALAGTRLLRPSSWALVLVLIAVMLTPLAVHPPIAEATNCGPLPGAVCDAPGEVVGVGKDVLDTGAGVVGDVGGALGSAAGKAGDLVGKVAKAAAGKVVDAWQWAEAHSGKILAGLAAAGIGIATWVACSRVTKVLTAAGAGVAGGTATGGTGGVPSALAGAAAAQAACLLLKKGSKLVLRFGPKVLRILEKLKGIAKKSAEATGLAALFYGTQHAAAWVLANVLVFDEPSAPKLSDGWLTTLRGQLDGLAGLLLLLATILGLTLAVVSGRLSDVGRVFSRMVGAALIIGVVGALLLTTLQMSDAVTTGALDSKEGQKALGTWRDLGDVYADVAPKKKGVVDKAVDAAKDVVGIGGDGAAAGTPPDDGKGPWVVRLLIALATAVCAALVKLEMVVRDALLYLLLVFGGLLLSSSAFPSTRHLAQRFGMTLLGVVVAKPVIVIALLIGGRFMASAADAEDDAVIMPMLQGAGLLALSAFLGWSVLAWFNVQGVAAFSGIGARLRGTATGDEPGGDGEAGTTRGRSGAPGSAASEPVRALARSTGDRVDAGAGEAIGAGPGSGRLARLRAREQTSGAGAVPGAFGGGPGDDGPEDHGPPAAGGGALVPSRATGTSSSPGGGAGDASSGSGGWNAMSGGPAPASHDAPGDPAPGAGDAVPGTGGAGAPGRSRGGDADPSPVAPSPPTASGSGAGGAGALLATAGGLPVVPGGAPGASTGGGGSSAGGPGGAPFFSGPGPVVGGGASGSGLPVGPGVVDHDPSQGGASDPGASSPSSAPLGSAPTDEHLAPVLVAAGPAPPPDPIDAFGSHSSSVRQMLDAHDDTLRSIR